MKKLVLNRIKEIRYEQGLTVSDVAIKSGLSQSAITQLENFNRVPSQLSILKISKAFNLPVYKVFMLDWHKLD